MNRQQLGLLFVSTLIVIVSAFSRNINAQELASGLENRNVMNAEQTKLTAKDFLYVVNNTITTVPCILTNMSINVTVPYTTKDKKDVNKTLTVPNNATVDGHCSSVISEMKLIWKENNTDKESTIKFIFINDHENFSLFSIGFDIYLNEIDSINSKGDSFNATSDIDLHLFSASVTNGFYKCEREEVVIVDNVKIYIKNVSLIAFYKNGDIFAPKEEQCSDKNDKTRTFPYVSRDENSMRICSLARMSISLKIPYRKNNMQNDTAIIEVPTTLKVSGKCDSSRGISTMLLIWDPEVSKNESTFENKKTNEIVFYIQREKIDSHVALITADIFVDNTHFKDAQNAGDFIQILAPFKDLFSTTAANGIHSCPEKTFRTMANVTVTIRNVLLVAFDAEQDFASKQVTDCRSSYFERDFAYIVRRTDTGIPCTLARMSINATVLYKKGDTQNNRTLNVPSTAVVSGNCGNKSSEMTLSWSESEKNDAMNKITFYIGRNETNFYVYQVTATVYYDKNDKTTDIHGESYIMHNLFSASGISGLYNCISLIHEIKVDDIHLNITNVTFIAFNTEEYLNPKKVTECSTNSGGDVTTTESPILPVVGYPYVVRNKQNVPCIAANMTISIKVPYTMKNTSNTNQTTLTVPIENGINVNGTCENKKSIMNLIWTENSEADFQDEHKENKVTINFVNDGSNYFIRSMNLSIYLDKHNFPGANAAGTYINVTMEKLDIFSTPLNNVYKCSDKISVNAENVVVTIGKVSLIAFNKAADITSKSVNCANNESVTDSNTGAIVGGIIGGIILVAIIGYLGVMYKRKRGYGV